VSPYIANEIRRITELVGLKKMRIDKSNDTFDNANFRSFNLALDESGIGFFEWNSVTNSVYLSNSVFQYCGVAKEEYDTYYSLLLRILDETAMYHFLVAFESVFIGNKTRADVEIPVFSHLHQMTRSVKIIFIKRQAEESGEFIIVGTSQDMTELNNSISELAESRNMLHQLVNAIPMPIFYVNRQNVIEFANNAVAEVLGIGVEDWINKDLEKYYKFIQEHLSINKRTIISEGDEKSVYEISGSKNNEQIELLIDAVNIVDRNGNISGKVYVHSDITNRIKDIQMVKKLLKANELLVTVGNMVDRKVSSDQLYKVILDGIVEIVSNADKGCILLFDYNNNMYIKKSIGYDSEYAKNFRIPFEDSFAKKFLDGNYRRSVHIKNIQDTYGDIFPDINNELRGFVLESNITSPISVDGILCGIISIDSSEKGGFDDIDLNLIDFLRSKIEISINRFKELSHVIEKSQRDELTGLYNRHFLSMIIESLITESIMEHKKFCLVVFDLDRLKVINDTFGHLAGDALIKKFSAVLSSKIREGDILARIGGDEFVGLFRDIDSETLVVKINHIAQEFDDNPIDYNEEVLMIEFSFGISVFPDDGEQIEDLIAVADERMYKQKMKKKGKVRIETE